MVAPVLVLNANFEPLNVCSTRRAIHLILSGKAGMVANGRGEIHTVSLHLPRPSVIRLNHMIKRPRPVVRLSKREILRRDDYTCQYCGQRSLTLTLDHVMPRSRGGAHTWENLVAACPACNHRKGRRTLEASGMHLLRLPTRPPSSAMYVFGRYLSENGEWLPYVDGW